jgi:glycosyltransferase involved in cell wall biosynthesis
LSSVPHRPDLTNTLARSTDRVRLDGKFFRLGSEKFWVKGVTYGPFGPRSSGESLPEPLQLERDLLQIRELGANTLRVYHAPPRVLLDSAVLSGLRVLVDIPWSKHRCFLGSRADREEARRAVRDAVRACGRHPGVFAYSVVNEIPPDVVRWLGPKRVEAFIDELVDVARHEDPAGMMTFASFPPTEYLHPVSVDFYTMNVYLHAREKFRAYLQRLQNQSDEKPLLLGEYGIDSIRNGEQQQAELLGMHLEEVFRCGLAGTCVFSYTDEWFTGGHAISDWAFGLVRADRSPKPAFERVASIYRRQDPLPPLPRYPRVSVVVCSYNGAKTLDGCLKSLQRLNYPDYEVIVVDDGSTDAVPEIAARYPYARYFRQANKGLSVARNVGMGLASGEVIAYTDDDCFADEDWLYFLAAKLLESEASGVGGPNLLPAGDGPVAACVSASPGTPAHVLIDDNIAEHVPGCNMAFWADRLRAIGGFDPVYRTAGDDVDVCWRLQEQGEKIVYGPAAMVWHHRRSTVRAYVKQQRGYGQAEALLKRKHPDKFRGFRNDLSWLGRIYTRAGLGLNLGQPVIHYGPFGAGMFQTIYSAPQLWWPLIALSLEWWIASVAVLGLSFVFHPTLLVLRAAPGNLLEDTILTQVGNPLVLLPLLMWLATLGVAYLVAGQASPPVHQRRWWSRLLIAAMHVAQPVERGYARYSTRFKTISIPESLHELRRSWEPRAGVLLRRAELELWSEQGVDRQRLLDRLLALAAERRWFVRLDPGWSARDVRFYGDRWFKADLLTVTENHGGGKRLTRLRLRVQPTLYHSALVLLLGYVLALSWFLDGRWALAFAPFLAAVGWRLSASRRRLRATVNACVLAVAEELGLSVVGAPGILGRGALERPDPAAEEDRSAPAGALAEGAGASGPRARLGL